jgi:hypothetical protein
VPFSLYKVSSTAGRRFLHLLPHGTEGWLHKLSFFSASDASGGLGTSTAEYLATSFFISYLCTYHSKCLETFLLGLCAYK